MNELKPDKPITIPLLPSARLNVPLLPPMKLLPGELFDGITGKIIQMPQFPKFEPNSENVYGFDKTIIDGKEAITPRSINTGSDGEINSISIFGETLELREESKDKSKGSEDN